MNIYLDRADFNAADRHTNIDRDTTSNSARVSTGNVQKSGFALDISGTVMDNSAYAGHGRTAEEVMLEAGQQDIATRRNYMAVMSNCMSDEDFAKLNEEGFHPGSTEIETVVTIVDHIKTAMMKGGTQVAGYTDTVDKEVLKNITGSEVFAKELQKEFAKRDIPLTEANVASVVDAWNQLAETGAPTEGSVKYMIENNLTPSAENLYTAKYSATQDGSRQGRGYYAAGSVAGYYAKKPEQIDFGQLLPQMEKVVEEAGFAATSKNLEGAKWLVEKGIPLNTDTYLAYQGISKLQFPIQAEEFIQAAACAIADGKSPLKADLNQKETYIERAEALTQKTQQLSEEAADIISARDLPFNLKNLFAAQEMLMQSGGQQAAATVQGAYGSLQITAEFSANVSLQQSEARLLKGRRLLEEVRLSMTVEANLKLLKSGYQIETASIEELVGKLKEAESSYETALTGKTDVKQAAESASLYKESLSVLQGIRTAPAAIVAQVEGQDTLHKVHGMGQNRALEYQRAGETYEALMTAPRRDMGDSIQKAFRNVDDILADMDFALTDENRRAVRILGYNHMEINHENIRKIREKDEQLTDIVNEMKPGRVLQMIREGINPINMPLDELQQYLQQQENPAEEMESYSKFLHQLEQQKGITEEERSAYIGVYRLLRQIEKGDDAAVGALWQTGAEFTLENLLTAVRTGKRGSMDYKIDDSFGGVDAKKRGTTTITSQIAEGFGAAGVQSTSELKQILEQNISDIQADEEAAAEFDRMTFENIRKSVQTEEAVLRQLADYSQPITADNIASLQTMLKDPAGIWKRTKDVEDELKEASSEEKTDGTFLAQAGEEIANALSDKESAGGAYDSLITRVQDMIEQAAYLKEDSLDVRALGSLYKQMSFLGSMAREENYEIPTDIDGMLTSINLKLIHNSKEESKAVITFETEVFGKVAAEFKLTEQGVSGFCICTSKEATDMLKSSADALTDRLTKEEIRTGEIYFAAGESLNPEEISLRESKDRKQADGSKELYKTAKAFIGFVQEIGRKKGSEGYENQF